MEKIREGIKDKKRIVIKIGSSSLQHKETGDLDYTKLAVLCRELCNIRNQGKKPLVLRHRAMTEDTWALNRRVRQSVRPD